MPDNKTKKSISYKKLSENVILRSTLLCYMLKVRKTGATKNDGLLGAKNFIL